MKNYIIAVSVAFLVLAIGYSLAGKMPPASSLFVGAFIFIAFGCYHVYKTSTLLGLIDRASKAGNEVSQRQIKSIVENDKLLNKILEAAISAIIFVAMALATVFIYETIIVSYTAACVFMLVASDIRGLVAEIAYEEYEDV